jgi:hypothetical protein
MPSMAALMMMVVMTAAVEGRTWALLPMPSPPPYPSGAPAGRGQIGPHRWRGILCCVCRSVGMSSSFTARCRVET